MTLRVELGWPAPELSPNARVHPMVFRRFKRAAKNEAGWATKIALQLSKWEPSAETIRVQLLAHPPKNWSTGDRDNFVARVKAALDGIAAVLRVNDRIFEAPIVTWLDKTEHGKLIVELS